MSRRSLFTALIVLIAVVTLAAVLWRHFPIPSIGQSREDELDLGSVVTRVRDLSRLETASMHVVQVSTISQGFEYVPNGLGGDELTLFAAGDVIAGVDLSLISTKDVHRDPDGAIVLRLPPAQILVSRVDNRETHVVARKTGLLRHADTNLEGRARLHAETAIRSEAMKKGILPLASRNAQEKLAQFLLTLGAKKVRFEETPASGG